MPSLEKLQPLVLLGAVGLGLALGRLEAIAANASNFILPSLLLLLITVFYQVPLRNFAAPFGKGPVAGLSLVVNFVWNPLFAWGLGWLFLRDEPALWLGFLLLMVTPCTDWYLVFIQLARGNLALGTSLLPWNLVLQILLLPLYMLVLGGAVIQIEWRFLWESVGLVLGVPLAAALLLRTIVPGMLNARSRRYGRFIHPSGIQMALLALAIAAMFAAQGEVLVQNPLIITALLPPLLLFFGINFAVAYGLAARFRLAYGDYAALCCTILARNSPLALAIAVVAFPEQPLIALTLVIGPLIELPVLGGVAQLLLAIRKRDRILMIKANR